MVELSQVKQYLRIDTDEEDALLGTLMKVAETYLVDAIGGFRLIYELDVDFAAKADFVMLVLTAELYANRADDNHGDYSYAVRTLINQLAYWSKEYEELEAMEAITSEEIASLVGASR